ncbi:hypothetical protein [Sinomicrobium weinanense]|uniref:hypothetical protein n=1 Tax=Sinomicrobium weinanense TaxID=2842200 RepID=UPI003CD0C897
MNRLSVDLKSECPDMGVSPRNLWDMKRFYERYRDASMRLYPHLWPNRPVNF